MTESTINSQWFKDPITHETVFVLYEDDSMKDHSELKLLYPDGEEFVIQYYHEFIYSDNYEILMDSSGQILIDFWNYDGDDNNHHMEQFDINKRIWQKRTDDFDTDAYTLVGEYEALRAPVRGRGSDEKYVILPYKFKE